MKNIKYICGLALLVLILVHGAAHAEDGGVTEQHLTLANHAFDPQSLTLPAGKKVKLIITNKDASAAEFESDDLRREKIIPANGEVSLFVGPLDAGTYAFFDDFHRASTTGTLVVK